MKRKRIGAAILCHRATKRKRIVDYVYWDDPNQLIDRLRLLSASQVAGNVDHTNEIISIIRELREAEIIH